jgi:hypothetical protein
MVRFICAQPANDYYLWQVEVMIKNFMRFGVNPNYIDVLLMIENNEIPSAWKILQNHYNTVRFFFYNDSREDSTYIPAIYFHLLKKHLTEHPALQEEPLLLCDSDVILTKEIPNSWKEMLRGDAWYVADTNSYINYDYIQSKGNHIYEKMCEIVGIDKLIPKLMNSNSGGAQYLTKGTTPEFWDKVEKDACKLYNYFVEIEPSYDKRHEGDYPIQKWTAGMWSLLWNAWINGCETIVDDRLGFSWSTDSIDKLDKWVFLHNAGVTVRDEDLFYKGHYINNLPYKANLDVNPNRCSYFYWNEVKEAGKSSPLLTN